MVRSTSRLRTLPSVEIMLCRFILATDILPVFLPGHFYLNFLIIIQKIGINIFHNSAPQANLASPTPQL